MCEQSWQTPCNLTRHSRSRQHAEWPARPVSATGTTYVAGCWRDPQRIADTLALASSKSTVDAVALVRTALR
jgi:hypothetical protein